MWSLLSGGVCQFKQNVGKRSLLERGVDLGRCYKTQKKGRCVICTFLCGTTTTRGLVACDSVTGFGWGGHLPICYDISTPTFSYSAPRFQDRRLLPFSDSALLPPPSPPSSPLPLSQPCLIFEGEKPALPVGTASLSYAPFIFETALLSYNRYATHWMYLMWAIWGVWMHTHTCETITTIKVKDTPITPRSFLCVPFSFLFSVVRTLNRRSILFLSHSIVLLTCHNLVQQISRTNQSCMLLLFNH